MQKYEKNEGVIYKKLYISQCMSKFTSEKNILILACLSLRVQKTEQSICGTHVRGKIISFCESSSPLQIHGLDAENAY